MKKLLCLFSAALLVFASCSNDDKDSSDPKPSAPTILVKKITEFEKGNPVSSNVLYNGNKIISITYADGSLEKYTYTGDFITKIEDINEKGELRGTTEYNYANGKLTSFIEKNASDLQYYYKTKYVHNADGTVSYEDFKVVASSGAEAKQKTGKLTFKDGNLIKDERSYSTNNSSVDIYEYDTKNNPYKNITGFSLLLVSELSVNNIIKETDTSTSGSNINTYVTTYSYKYDANSYPIEVIATYPSGSNSTSTETTQYAY